MQLITVLFPVKEEHADRWPELVRDLTERTLAEAGNKWYTWARCVENPNDYLLTEGYDDDAVEAHITSEHFQRAQRELPQYLRETPKFILRQVEGDGWDALDMFSVN